MFKNIINSVVNPTTVSIITASATAVKFANQSKCKPAAALMAGVINGVCTYTILNIADNYFSNKEKSAEAEEAGEIPVVEVNIGPDDAVNMNNIHNDMTMHMHNTTMDLHNHMATHHMM